jgi:ABC-type enterochelin transport system permease subunit
MTCKKLFIEIGIGLCILLSVGFLCTLVGSEPISLSSIRESPQNAQIFFEVRIPRVILAM